MSDPAPTPVGEIAGIPIAVDATMDDGEVRAVMTEDERLIGRPRLHFRLLDLDRASVLVTGAEGFIGQRVAALCRELGADVVESDLPGGDLLSDPFREWLAIHDRFDVCVHLAAHKYAAMGEERPASVADVNVRGTARLVELLGRRVVLASTCKAADPATVYGASKMIAERIVLNAGGRVLRLVNVVGSSGSVVERWRATPAEHPLEVAACKRMWMTPAEAAEALVAVAALPSGRYAPDVGEPEPVRRLATRLAPERRQAFVPLRRGDRPVERLVAEGERVERVPSPGLIRIRDLWE